MPIALSSFEAAAALPLAAGAAELSPPQRALHLLGRLGYGPRPGDLERVESMGMERYIDEQFHPERLAEPAVLQRQLAAFDSLSLPVPRMYLEVVGPLPAAGAAAASDMPMPAKRPIGEAMLQAQRARVLRAVYSPRQLQEVMLDFWFNHFNVYLRKGLVRLWLADYEREAIRPHVFGRFRELLGATAHHPAMLNYLDNEQSKGGGINENYARELLELHTLGVDGGYTQQDVSQLAAILTGWTYKPLEMRRGDSRSFVFDQHLHQGGDKQLLGRVIHGGGEEEGEQALDLLARHPATARHLAFELAQYFVADEPPPALVERLARSFRHSDGDIREVLQTLFASAEFRDPACYRAKFKNPWQYVISSLRATGVTLNNAQPALNALIAMGMEVAGCPTPDGYKNTQAAWLSPDAMLQRVNYSHNLGSGALPLWRSPAAPVAALLPAGAAAPDAEKPPPPDAEALLDTFGRQFSESTLDAVDQAEPRLRAGVVLASPEFMRH
jgi:hypothetical protein